MAEEVKGTETVEEAKAPETGADEAQTQQAVTAEELQAQVERMQAALKKANAEAAKFRKEAEAATKAEQARKDAELSEAEKLQKELAEARGKLKSLELGNLKREAAMKAGLPEALALRLQGETAEELEADAAELAKTLPKKTAAAVGATNPGGNASGGAQKETDEQRRKRLFG